MAGEFGEEHELCSGVPSLKLWMVLISPQCSARPDRNSSRSRPRRRSCWRVDEIGGWRHRQWPGLGSSRSSPWARGSLAGNRRRRVRPFAHLAERARAFLYGPVVHVLKECSVDGFELVVSNEPRMGSSLRRPGAQTRRALRTVGVCRDRWFRKVGCAGQIVA